MRVLLSGQELQGDAMPSGQNPSRRVTSRVAGLSDLWPFWNCKKHDGLSRVLDLSAGGLCLSIEKSERIVVGEKVHLNSLTRYPGMLHRIVPYSLGIPYILIVPYFTSLGKRLLSIARRWPYIQRCGLICDSQSWAVGIRPRSSLTCCSPIYRTGTWFPSNAEIVLGLPAELLDTILRMLQRMSHD